MTVVEMHVIRSIISCQDCETYYWDLCFRLLTPEQRNEYAARYGCICGCDCNYCKDKGDCER